jgi:hypothetical protein
MTRLPHSHLPAAPARVRAWPGVADMAMGGRDALSLSRAIVVLRDVVPH